MSWADTKIVNELIGSQTVHGAHFSESHFVDWLCWEYEWSNLKFGHFSILLQFEEYV